MAEIYIEYRFEVSPLQPTSEILIAELGTIDFESFVETETGVLAYIQKKLWNPEAVQELWLLQSPEFTITFEHSEIAPVNWNEEWEKNFTPIEVANKCVVRAPFHPETNKEYEIVIEPKMAFGTGHHETTYMMLEYILELDFEGKTVLDMGCGTAVLAILAEMRGAATLDAVDIDSWCYENSLENIARNKCQSISVYLGDASFLEGKKYDVIIANINRNILLQDMAHYQQSLLPGGTLLLSGFYREDLEIIQETCQALGLDFVGNKERNRWIAAEFRAKEV